MRYTHRMKRWFRRYFRPQPTGPLPIECLIGLSIHAVNEPEGTSALARQTWDDVTGYDIADYPDGVPFSKRPWWYLKTGGRRPLSNNFLDEIGERQAKGYNVSFVNKRYDRDALKDNLSAMKAHGVAPDCFGLGNEPDLSGRFTPHELRQAFADLPQVLQEFRSVFGGRYISAPALASLSHAAGPFGRVYGDLFAGITNVAAKGHSYGRFLPSDIVRHQAKERILAAQGLPDDGLLLLEESANAFAGEGDMKPRDEIVGDQGAEFLYAMVLAGGQGGFAPGHFMLEHGGSPNDIAHPDHGRKRRDAVRRAVADMRAWSNPGGLDDLDLANPKGHPINPALLP